MLVYRVGHRTMKDPYGIPRGPYRFGDWSDETLEHRELSSRMCWEHDIETHPTPFNDLGLGWIDASEYCVFESLASLVEWFGDFVEDLFCLDFEIHVYDVPDMYVRCGEYQAVARLETGKWVNTLCLIESRIAK